jgi:acetate---CoA ligase (ADP-forming)
VLDAVKSDATLHRMLWARNVAVVGASSDPTKFGNVLLKSLIDGGFAGDIYPVNPKADVIHGLQCYPSVAAIPGTLDLAVIVVPAAAVPPVIEQVAEKGAAGIFLLSGGFKESGRPDLERAVVAAVRERGMRMFGPNTQGIAYAPNNLSAVFWPVLSVPGPVGVVGQSGTVVAAITDWALAEGLGASASVSLGNQADLCESDVLRYLDEDELTRSVALYLEGVSDGPRFVQTLREVGPSLPIVILKCGRSPRGREAVASHTGSLAGSDEIFAGMCRQFGVVRAHDTEELYDYAKVLATMKPPTGRRVLMMSSSGGSCALAADAAFEAGLEMPAPPPGFVEALRRLDLPEWGSFANPLDLGGVSLDAFRAAVELADEAGMADTILLVYGDPIEGADELALELASTTRASICAAIFGGAAVEKEQRWTMQQGGVPVFPSPERAIKAIGASCWYHERRRELEARR